MPTFGTPPDSARVVVLAPFTLFSAFQYVPKTFYKKSTILNTKQLTYPPLLLLLIIGSLCLKNFRYIKNIEY